MIRSHPCRQVHLPSFLAHFDCFGGSDISKDVNFGFAFSTSVLLVLGVFGTSFIFVNPLVDLLLLWISFGKVDLLGVRAVATLRADFRMLLRISHDLFFARYHNTAETPVDH